MSWSLRLSGDFSDRPEKNHPKGKATSSWRVKQAVKSSGAAGDFCCLNLQRSKIFKDL
jgi:hypothetical protein